MQPRNIQVFDGLRITTEHIDHLQGAIHSAIGDVREILGLGQIHRGFAVTAIDEKTLEVGPGVAFDRNRRRIVIDEPVQLDIAPLTGSETRYVCLSYNEVADGEVEGQPTRVWDSGTVEVRGSAPSAAEDTIVLGRLVAAPDGGFEIRPRDDGESLAPAAVQPAPEGTAASSESPAEAATGTPVRPAPVPPVTPAPAPTSVRPDGIAATVAIGVDDTTVSAALIGKLPGATRERLTSAGAIETPVLRERVAVVEAFAGIPLATVATHGTLAMECEYSPPPGNDGGTPPPPLRWRVESVMHGHAAFTGAPPQQCSAGTILSTPPGRSDARVSALFGTDSVLRVAAAGAAGDREGAEAQFIEGLSLVVTLVARNGDGFGADVWIQWNGTPGEAIAAWVEQVKPAVRCRGMLGWSAQRPPNGAPSASPR